MGMTYDQFWDGSPYLAITFRKAYKLRRQIGNEQAWLQGLYVYNAFEVCLGNAFSKKGSKRLKYIEQPIDIFPPTEAEKKRREQAEYAKMQKALEAMIASQRHGKLKGD